MKNPKYKFCTYNNNRHCTDIRQYNFTTASAPNINSKDDVRLQIHGMVQSCPWRETCTGVHHRMQRQAAIHTQQAHTFTPTPINESQNKTA